MKDIKNFINESIKKKEIKWNGLELIEHKDRQFSNYFHTDINSLKTSLIEYSKTEDMPKYKLLRDDYEDHGRLILIVRPEDKDKMEKILKKYKKDFTFDDGPIKDGFDDNEYWYWCFV